MNAPHPRSPLLLAAQQCVTGKGGQIGLCDLSLTPRFGVKGPGAAEWLMAAGIPLPAALNAWFRLSGGGLVARLGQTEYLIDGDAELVARLQATPRAHGVYPVLRQDAALALSGPRLQALLRQVCNVNLARLAEGNEVVLTSMAGVGVTVLAEARDGSPIFRLWCDGTYGHYLWDTLCLIAAELGGGPVAYERLP